MKPALLTFILLTSPAAAQTTLYKSPPSADYICRQNAAIQTAKIVELKTIIAQLQARVLLADAKEPVKVKRKRRGRK